MNCTRFCTDEKFVSQLNHFRIAKGPHARSEDAAESLISCISEIIPEVEVRRNIMALVIENNSGDSIISTDADSLMHAGSEFEFGRHDGMYFFNSRSILGLLMAISNVMNIKIYVICGRLPLKRLHKNEKVLLFENGSETATKMVIGLIGLTIFHKLQQPGHDSSIWTSLDQNCRKVNYEYLDSFSTENANEITVPRTSRLENEEPGSEEPIIEPIARNNVGGLRNVSIENFISANSEVIAGQKIKIFDSAYNCQERIDFILSSTEQFSGNRISELNFLIDIDAYFGFHYWENSTVFHGDVIFNRAPTFDCKREEGNFKSLYASSLNIVLGNIMFLKIGLSSGNKNIIYDIFFCGIFEQNYENVELEMIRSKLSNAFKFALDAPCYDVHTGNNLHPTCESKVYRSVLDAHSNNIRPNKISLSNNRYKCFCYHFEKHLKESLRLENIILSQCFQYIQTVGTKAKLYSETVNGITIAINEIRSVIDVDKIHSFYDVAFSVYAITNDPTNKVSSRVINS